MDEFEPQDGLLKPHPLRARLLAEVHARPFAPVETPRRVLHYAFLTNADEAAADRAAMAALCADNGLPGPGPGARHHRAAFSGCSLGWESHGEFTTYTWSFGREGGGTVPFGPPADTLAGTMRLVPQPGPLLAAVDLHLLPADVPEADPERLFGAVGLAAASVEDGAAILATDFRADPRGFVRILVVNRSASPAQAGAIVQRALEVETYRVLALLGLPHAQDLGPAIGRLETELPTVMAAMQRSVGFEDNHRLLQRLTGMAAELEAGATGSLFRFGATRAYAELIRLRLDALGERPLPGVATWSSFLSRRFEPAIRTCTATERRQDSLSQKLARAAQLLRTRVDVEGESQNRELLHAMNRRSGQQLRLQQTVEGLSVAAITYYVASLVHHVLEGLHKAGLHVDPTVGTAVAIPFVLVAVAFVVRRIRQRHADEPHR